MVGALEVSNRLIVESKNDKFFIQALVNYLNTSSVDFKKIDIEENAYLALDGSDPTKTESGLQKIKDEAQKNPIDKLGIVLDMDYKQPLEWFEIINKAIANIFPLARQNKIEKASDFITVTSEEILDIQVACYLTNVDGTGELETLLKEIKSQDSTYADCLDAWQYCLQQNNKEAISKKDFDKFWVSNYIRFDTCSKNDKKQAKRKCSMLESEDDKLTISGQLKDKSGFKYIMTEKIHIWNFEHPALDELKGFLKLFD